jgi:hypothetical protein
MNELKIGLILSATDKMSRVVDMAVGKSEKKLSKFQRSADKIGSKMQKIGAGMMTAGVAVTGAMFAAVKHESAAASEYLRTSQKVGMSSENWQKVEYAAGRVNVASESLRISLQRFSKTQVNALKGNKTAQAAFKMVGVSILDHNKKLKSSHKMLLQIADAFSKAKNGPVKTATAIMLFGKAGADMIPMLNKGSKGIKDFGDRADKMGLIMSGKDAQSMKDFALKMRTMKDATSGITRMITIAALPAMMQLANFISSASEKIVKWVKQNRSLVNTIVKIVGAVGAILTVLGAFILTFGTLIRSISIGIKVFQGIKVMISLTSGPIGIIILAVGALTAGVIYCWTHFAKFRAVILTVWDTVKGFAVMLKDYVIERIKGIADGIGLIGKALESLFSGKFKEAFQEVSKGVTSLSGVEAKATLVKRTKNIVSNVSRDYRINSIAEQMKQNRSEQGESRSVAAVTRRGIINNATRNSIKKSSHTQTIAYSPTINIGSGSEQEKQDFAKMLRTSKSELASLLKEINNNNSRLSFEG